MRTQMVHRYGFICLLTGFMALPSSLDAQTLSQQQATPAAQSFVSGESQRLLGLARLRSQAKLRVLFSSAELLQPPDRHTRFQVNDAIEVFDFINKQALLSPRMVEAIRLEYDIRRESILNQAEALQATVGARGIDQDSIDIVFRLLPKQTAGELEKGVAEVIGGRGNPSDQQLRRLSASGSGIRVIPGERGDAEQNWRTRPDGAEPPENWTATLKIGDRAICTGTLVGPRVLLTAAHCVIQSPVFSGTFGGKTYTIQCDVHPSYRRTGALSQLDYALCLLDHDFPKTLKDELDKDVDVKFERLSLSPEDAMPRYNQIRAIELLLAGYGCTNRNRLQPQPSLSAGHTYVFAQDALQMRAGSPNRRDSAIICFGDSGGAVYKKLTPNPYGPRRIVAVNSATILTTNQSFLSKTSSVAFITYFRAWRERHQYPLVCGIDIALDRGHDRICHP